MHRSATGELRARVRRRRHPGATHAARPEALPPPQSIVEIFFNIPPPPRLGAGGFTGRSAPTIEESSMSRVTFTVRNAKGEKLTRKRPKPARPPLKPRRGGGRR